MIARLRTLFVALASALCGLALFLSATPALATASAPTATPTSTPHHLYVAVITNRGTVPSDATIATQVDAMRAYWHDESNGLIGSFTQPSATVRFASTAAGTPAQGCGIADPSPVWTEAAARFPGVTFTAGNHLMVLVSNDCSRVGGAGIATEGSSINSGGRTMVTLGSGAVQTGVHELGHNLSLEHANAQSCAVTCTTQTYYDLYSPMGAAVIGAAWTPPTLDSAERLRDGIDTAADVPALTATRTLHLSARSASSGVRGLVARDPRTGSTYVVEYRSGTGRDATAFYTRSTALGPFSYRPGVTVERVEADGQTTLVTRASGSTNLTSYLAGDTITIGALVVTVVAAAPSTGADVTVTFPGEPAAFVSAAAPGISGTARVGERLTATAKTWTPTATTASYQWLDNGAAIGGATAASLTLTPALLGHRVSVRVTGSRAGYATTSATSAAAPVAAGVLLAGHPTISGTTAVGGILHAAAGSWRPSPHLGYRWYATGRPIAGATGTTLHLTANLRKQRIDVVVTGTASGLATSAATSALTAPVR